MGRSPGIVEDLETVRRIPLGRLLGVPVAATPLVWVGPLLAIGQGALLSLLQPGRSRGERLAIGVAVGLAGEITNLAHAAGHVAGGRLVGSPMDELLLTATRIANLYHGDQTGAPPRVHLGRALGGPAANAALAALLALPAVVLPAGPVRRFVRLLAAMNAATSLLALLPIPSVDGEVVWREAGRLRVRADLISAAGPAADAGARHGVARRGDGGRNRRPP